MENQKRQITSDIYQLKRKYKRYMKYLRTMSLHIDKLMNDYILSIDARNSIQKKFDKIISKSIKIHNKELAKIGERQTNKESSNSNSTTGIFPLSFQEEMESCQNIINMIDSNTITIFKDEDPFSSIKYELYQIAKKYGFDSIKSCLLFMTELTNPSDLYCILNKSFEEYLEVYDELFVPLKTQIINGNDDNDVLFKISPWDNKYDSLMFNACRIEMTIPRINTKVIMDGYICSDSLNTYIRTARMYSAILFEQKRATEEIIYSRGVTKKFYTEYLKYTTGGIFFIYHPEDLAAKIHSDYIHHIELLSQTQNSIIKNFLKYSLREMFLTVNVLLMGDEQMLSTATLIFDMLKEKKIGGINVSNIIYKNLPFKAQKKLDIGTFNYKSELARIKTLTIDNISVEKRLASMSHMPDAVKSYIMEKNHELKTGENNYKIQMAINGLFQFPWKPSNARNEYAEIRSSLTKSREYLKNIEIKLNEHVFGHQTSKQALTELVGKWIQNPESTGQVIGLVGPPGVGKTLLAKSISVALGIPLSIVGLGGMSDSADLCGHSYTYAGAQYGMIIRQMIKAGKWRCVLVFDEVDKASKRNDMNEIYSTLLHITDPSTNQKYQDRFYSTSIDFDLSGALIVFSYNSSENLGPILLDRIKEIEIKAYSTKEKIYIAKDYMMKELCASISVDYAKINIADNIIQYIIDKYTAEAGVRELRRKLEEILNKMNIDRFYMRGPFRKMMYIKHAEMTGQDTNTIKNSIIDEKDIDSTIEDILGPETVNKIFNFEIDNQFVIDLDIVHKYLGKPSGKKDMIGTDDLVGAVNGLYATSIGIGGLVPIQVKGNYVGEMTNNNGHIKLNIDYTGNQRMVMRESVMCALTVAISIVNETVRAKIPTHFCRGFHVNATDGGTPKDGPSAGCAFTTAFVSLLLGKKINRFISMTGEIDLTGKISQIGGLDIKLIGAKKSGIRRVYICEENRSDYELICKNNPELFDSTFEVVIINHIMDIVTDPYVICDVKPTDFDDNIEKGNQQSLQSLKGSIVLEND